MAGPLAHLISISGKYLTPSELEFQLREVKKAASKKVPANGVGQFTLMERTPWAKIKNEMLQHAQNRESFDAIDTAPVVRLLPFSHLR